jgi:GR25 family glycosyltransferase involved in LPS biosynthesis
LETKSGTGESFDVPVLILGFNRPEDCRKVIQELRKIKAKEVFFSVDGPRHGSVTDPDRVREVQELSSLFDWDCNLHVRFLKENLGCKLAISTGITWFFENVEEGIILEDDCVPSHDFFQFCRRMLSKYRDVERVMHISGTSYLPKHSNPNHNHYFSSLHEVWGWATWKRAWKHFNLDIEYLEKAEELTLLRNYFGSRSVARWFQRYVDDSKSPTCTLWSTYWSYSIIERDALSITPCVNLVQNIGFQENATHGDHDSFRLYNAYKVGKLPQLPDPPTISVDRHLDSLRFKVIKKTDPSLKFLGAARIRIKRIPSKVQKFFRAIVGDK